MSEVPKNKKASMGLAGGMQINPFLIRPCGSYGVVELIYCEELLIIADRK